MITLEVHLAVSRIVFSFAALAFAGLTLLWFRQRRQPHWPWPSAFYPLLFTCMAGWFVLSLVTSDFLILLAAGCLFPPLLHRLSGKRGQWATAALSMIIALCALLIWTGSLAPSAVAAVSAAYAVLLVITLLTGIRPSHAGNRSLWLAAGASALVAAALWTRNPWLTLTTRCLPLAFLFVESYASRRFLFLDLFVKWAVYYLLALSAVLAVLYFALPRLAPLPLAIVLLPLLYLVPAVSRRIGLWLDRSFLHRPLPAFQAQALFLDRTQPASTEPALIEQATLALTEIFRAPARIILDESPPIDPAARSAIRAGGLILGWIVLDHRPDNRPYFSEDYQLLDSLAASFASTLENRRAQVRALHAQINPHFLFNSLNTIASLIHDDPDLAESTVLRLSGIFRHALDRARSEWTTLAVEFDFIDDCIAVERARFGEFSVLIELPDDLRGFRIPSMALHILVENAFKHGLSKAGPPRRIEVTAGRLPAAIRLRVTDNGPGPDSAGHPPGRGLAILGELLARHYGGRASFTLARDPTAGLTVATMEIPV